MKNNYFLKTVQTVAFLLLLGAGTITAQNKYFLDFDGSNDYVKYADDATLDNLNGASNYTLEAWVYVSSSCASGAQILHRTNQFYIYYYSTSSYPDALDFKVYDGSDYQLYYSKKNTLTTNTWHHIAIVRNNTSSPYLHIYIDGIDQRSADKNAYALESSNDKNLYIGNDGNGGNYFKGYIDEVRLKKVAVNLADLQTHVYDNQYASDGNTAALFHFNEGSTQYTKNEASGSNARLGSTDAGDAAEPAWRAWNYVSSHHIPLAHEWTGATDTTWATSDNWAGDIPAAANDVIIPAGLTHYPTVSVGTHADCRNLSVETNGNLTIASTSSGNGSLIVNGTVSGNATVQRYVAAYTPNTDDGWHLIGVPVNSMDIANSSFDPGNNNDLYMFDETASDEPWINYRQSDQSTHPFTKLTKGNGYLVAFDSDGTRDFVGQLNTKNDTISNLSYNSDGQSGWHLLGNPFSSAVKWNDGNWTLTNVGGVAQVWDEANATYKAVNANDTIPATNGFFVQVDAGKTGTVIIPAVSRLHGTTNNYKSTLVKSPKETLTFKITDDANSYADESTFGFKPDATEGWDIAYDAHKLMSMVAAAPQIWTVSNREEFLVNYLPEPTTAEDVPLNFKPGVNGVYHLSWKGIGSFNNDDFVLEDVQTGQKIDMRTQQEYDFTANKNDNPDRFVLHINGTTGIPGVNNTTGLQVYAYGNTVYLHAQKTLNGKVFVFNTLGQKVYEGLLNGATRQQLRLSSQPQGIYFVKVKAENSVVTRKVFIK